MCLHLKKANPCAELPITAVVGNLIPFQASLGIYSCDFILFLILFGFFSHGGMACGRGTEGETNPCGFDWLQVLSELCVSNRGAGWLLKSGDDVPK